MVDVEPRFKEPRPPKPRKQLHTRSAKRKSDERLYRIESKSYLAEHRYCVLQVPGVCTGRATEVHHARGRRGRWLLLKEWWKAACSPCHAYATANPGEAYDKGWSVRRNPTTGDAS